MTTDSKSADKTTVMDHYSEERLKPEIIAELERLGCQINSSEEIPEPRFVTFGDERVAVPEAYRQWFEDIEWPDAELMGMTRRKRNYRGLVFFNEIRAFDPTELGYDYPGAEDDRYLHFGYRDGNYLLLFDLLGDSTNPGWAEVDHDPYKEEPLTPDTLVNVLSCLHGSSESPERVQQYVADLSSSDGYLQDQAINALSMMGIVNDDVLSGLIKKLNYNRSNVPTKAVITLGKFKSGHEIIAPALAQLIGDLDAKKEPRKAKQEAARVLAIYGPSVSSVTPTLIEAIQNEPEDGTDIDWMTEVVKTITAINTEFESLPSFFLERFRDQMTATRYRLACAEALVAFMNPDDEEAVFDAFCEVLQNVHTPPELKEPLVNLFLKTDEDTGHYHPQFTDRRTETIEALEPLLERSVRSVRANTAVILHRLDALSFDEALPTLKEMLAGRMRFINCAQAAAIAATFGEKSRPLLPIMIQALNEYDGNNKIGPHLITLHADLPEVVDALEKACTDDNPVDLTSGPLERRRTHALLVIAKLGSRAKSTLPTVESCIDDPLHAISSAAERAHAALTGSDEES